MLAFLVLVPFVLIIGGYILNGMHTRRTYARALADKVAARQRREAARAAYNASKPWWKRSR